MDIIKKLNRQFSTRRNKGTQVDPPEVINTSFAIGDQVGSNDKIEFKINCSPHLKMSDITKRLFNRNFHSDVLFKVDDQIIYAHSLELIKRSVVFEEQLEDVMGDKKLLHVTDCKYESYLEFIRFLYTDECTITEDNLIDILKLAIKYKVIALENEILRHDKSMLILIYDFHNRDKYHIINNWMNEIIPYNFKNILADEQFKSLHPNTVEDLLKFDRVAIDVTEYEIFNAVVNWIKVYCEQHDNMTLAQGRQQFDDIFKKIRFPTMSREKIYECNQKYPELFTENDRNLIGRQNTFGISNGQSDSWISKPRGGYICPVMLCTFKENKKFETRLSVSKDTILYGLRIGVELARNPIEIEITETNEETDVSQKLTFVQNVPKFVNDLVICLGDSIRLKPNFKYSITTKYFEIKEKDFVILCRTEIQGPIINDPGMTVNIIQMSTSMIEMFFKPATDL